MQSPAAIARLIERTGIISRTRRLQQSSLTCLFSRPAKRLLQVYRTALLVSIPVVALFFTWRCAKFREIYKLLCPQNCLAQVPHMASHQDDAWPLESLEHPRSSVVVSVFSSKVSSNQIFRHLAVSQCHCR